MSDPLDQLPGWGRELLDRSPVARLGYLDSDDRPRVLPITFAVSDDRLWTVVDRKPKRDQNTPPARIRYLRRRPEVAVTVDRYSDDWGRLAWVQLLGRATVVEDPDSAPTALAALVARYPSYREEPPPGPLVRVGVERALSWSAA